MRHVGKIKVISSSNEELLEREVNRYLEELGESDKEVFSLQYRMVETMNRKENSPGHPSIEYKEGGTIFSALIWHER